MVVVYQVLFARENVLQVFFGCNVFYQPRSCSIQVAKQLRTLFPSAIVLQMHATSTIVLRVQLLFFSRLLTMVDCEKK